MKINKELLENITLELKKKKNMSTSYLQRKYKLSYDMAKQIFDSLDFYKENIYIAGAKAMIQSMNRLSYD